MLQDVAAGPHRTGLADSYSAIATQVEDEAADAAGMSPRTSSDRFWPLPAKGGAILVGLLGVVCVVSVLGWAVIRHRSPAPSLRQPGGGVSAANQLQMQAEYAAPQGTAVGGAVAGAGYYGTMPDQALTGAGAEATTLGNYNAAAPANPVGASSGLAAGGYATIADSVGVGTQYGSGVSDGGSAYAATPYGTQAAETEQPFTTTYTVTLGNGQMPGYYVPSGAAIPAVNNPYAGYTDEQMQAMYSTVTLTTTIKQDSLFCFALMMPHGYEKGLIRELHEKSKSIFACDDYTVFSETAIEITPGPPVRIVAEPMGSMKCEYGGPFKLALNTDVFIRAWTKVFTGGKYMNFAWTVKVDPDCVFLPSRLRAEVQKYAKPDDAVYLNNCDQGLHGPIEVLSRGGMRAFHEGIDTCTSNPKLVKEKKEGGEDVFLRHCMDLLDIQRVDNFALLSEQACFWEDPVKNGCTSGKVSFHPFKDTDTYFKCLGQAEELDRKASTTTKPPSLPDILPR